MALDYETAVDAVLDALKVKWDSAAPVLNGGVVPVLVFEQTEPDLMPHPKDGTKPWARAVVRHAAAIKATLAGATGTARYRRVGLCWVQVFVPGNSAIDWTKAQRLAMVAQDAFEGQRTPGDGVLFRDASIYEVPRDGAWYRFDVKVTFSWDQIR